MTTGYYCAVNCDCINAHGERVRRSTAVTCWYAGIGDDGPMFDASPVDATPCCDGCRQEIERRWMAREEVDSGATATGT